MLFFSKDISRLSSQPLVVEHRHRYRVKRNFSGKKQKAPPPLFDEKPLKFTGIWENFVQPPPLQCI